MIASLVLLLAAVMLPAAPVTCVKRTDLVQHLAERYLEVPAARGLSQDGTLLEIFASRDGASWTAVATFVDGTSCLLASGHFWEATRRIDLSPERPS